MKKINWGIIGCGDVTEIKSGPAFNKVDNSALVAVMRRNGRKAADYASRHHVPRWYDDAQKLIDDPDVNAICIATPPSSHLEYTLAAFNAGKPVYVEKPMSTDYASACKMANAAAEKSLPLVVAHYRREHPRFKKVKQLLADKVIGEPLLARLELTKPPLTKEELSDPRILWRLDPAIAGGGLFYDLAPHQLDLAYYFFGPVRKVNGVSTNQGGAYDVEDMVAGNILFKNDVVFSGTWCYSAVPEATADRVEITGTKGKINFTVFSEHTIVLAVNDETTLLEFDEIQHVQQPLIDATVKHFLGTGPNPCSGDEGAEIMRIIEEMIGV